MCLCFIRTQEALFGSVQTVEEFFPGAFTSLLLPRVSHLCPDSKQTERHQGLRGRVGALKQATCQGKAVETGMGEQGHLGRLAGPACRSCFVSSHRSQQRAGVCGLDKDVVQHTGPGISFRTATLLMVELSRALKLTPPLELLLTTFCLYPAHLSSCASLVRLSGSSL